MFPFKKNMILFFCWLQMMAKRMMIFFCYWMFCAWKMKTKFMNLIIIIITYFVCAVGWTITFVDMLFTCMWLWIHQKLTHNAFELWFRSYILLIFTICFRQMTMSNMAHIKYRIRLCEWVIVHGEFGLRSFVRFYFHFFLLIWWVK